MLLLLAVLHNPSAELIALCASPLYSLGQALEAAFMLIAQQPVPAPAGDRTRNALLALALGLAIFSSSLALGIAFGIRRRIDQIAGPPEDEDD
jgi:hypothetical protein